MEEKYLKTHEFISKRWKDGLVKEQNPEYPLPFPFEPPCVDGLFKCLFYWDTFYTNKGMIFDGLIEYAKYNTDNLIYLLNKYGFVPNSNSYPGITHNSQPPYLQYMINDVFEATKDEKWAKEAYEALKKEYKFWMSERMTPIGLNQYLHHHKNDDEAKIDMYKYVCTRLALDPNAPREVQIKAGSGLNADCESGLDFTPRFGLDGEDIVEPDLNAHLYALELNLAKWAKMFEPNVEAEYLKAAETRKQLMDKYLLREDGLYYDYNFAKKEIQQTEFCFTGQFVPFIAGVSKDKKALITLLSKLEFAYGIASTEPYTSELEYQAAYPYSWPYDNGLAFWALKTLHLKEDAKRVGMKYLTACANSYTIAGHLWETYSAIEDGIATKKEYPNKEMLGWTAGIYQWIYNYIKELENE